MALTLEDRILRLEIIHCIVNTPDYMIPVDRVQELHIVNGLGMEAAKSQCIDEYFEQKDMDNFSNRNEVTDG